LYNTFKKSDFYKKVSLLKIKAALRLPLAIYSKIDKSNIINPLYSSATKAVLSSLEILTP
jgi:hypothetical protein